MGKTWEFLEIKFALRLFSSCKIHIMPSETRETQSAGFEEMQEKIPECHRFHRWSCHRHSGHNLESSQTCGFRIQCLQGTRLWQFHWFAPLFRLVNMVLKGGHGWSLVDLRNVCSYFLNRD